MASNERGSLLNGQNDPSESVQCRVRRGEVRVCARAAPLTMAATLPTDRHRPEYTDHKAIDQDGPLPSIQRSRRQWNIQDGPRGLLRRMRSQLAEDGDQESQLVLAKALLDSANDYPATDEGGGDDRPRQAVFWLTRASLQGHEEATDLLRHCLHKDIGISEHNYHEVRQCLAMDRQEKLARRAAQHLFVSLSDGNEFVTSSMLAARIRSLLRDGEEERKEEVDSAKDESSLEARYGGERFLEEHLTAAATSYHQGYLPPLQHFLPPFECCLAPLPLNWLSGARLVKYFGGDVIRKLKYTYYSMSAGKSLMALFVLFCVSAMLGKDHLIMLLPWLVLATSLLGMAVATSTVLLNYRHLDEFKVWSIVLKHYCSELCTEDAENKFQNRWYVPYTGMLATLIIYLSVRPLLSNFLLCLQLPVLAVFALLSLYCSVIRVGVREHITYSFYVTARTASFYSLVSEYIKSVSPPSVYSYLELFPSALEYRVCSGLMLHLGTAAVCHVLWLLTVFICLLRKGWLATATLLVTATWWNLALEALNSIETSSDVIYCTALWTLVFISPVLWGFLTLSLPALGLSFLCFQFNASLEVTLAVVLGLLLVQGLVHRYLPNLYQVASRVLFWSVMVGLLLSSVYPSRLGPVKTNLKWDSYRNLCAPSDETEAVTSIRCRPLQGSVVSWQGKVREVSISSFTNLPETLLSTLPLSDDIKSFIACKLGEEVRPCNRLDMKLVEYERCVLLASLLGKERCSLENWSTYSLSVTVTMDSSYWGSGGSSEVVVMVGGGWSRTALALSEGQRLEFEGVLEKSSGVSVPEVRATKLRCDACKDTAQHGGTKGGYPSPYRQTVISGIGNFFLGPTITL